MKNNQNIINFEYSKVQLTDKAQKIIEQGLCMGATSVELEISEGIETSVEILNNSIDNVETFYSSVLSLTLYIGKRKGSIASSYNKFDDINTLISHALDIAKYTQEDDANGIPDKADLALAPFSRELYLYNPCDLSNIQLIEYAKELENQSLSLNKNFASNGSSLDSGRYSFITANSNGFCNGYQTTRFSSSISLIDKNTDNMQTDYWYATSRAFEQLPKISTMATQVNHRLSRRLQKGSINSGIYPVIFDSQVAKSLIAMLVSALNGNSIYRNLSFLSNSINTQIMPEWINIYDDPFVKQEIASCYFDNEGVTVVPRLIIKNGVVQTYIMSSYSARKLNMRPTGHSGGTHNITVDYNFAGNILDMAKTMGKGLIIIETIGSGINSVTGDYSVGASGLWVEHGNIQFFVDNITISGNLKTMYQAIEYIAADNDGNGSSINCGPILINQINISS